MNQKPRPADPINRRKPFIPWLATSSSPAAAHRRSLTRTTVVRSGRLPPNRPPAAGPPSGRRWRRRLGMGTLGLAAAIVATFGSGPTQSGPDLSMYRLASEPMTLVGLRARASEDVSYEPRASRTWSPGPHVVGVKVLSGRLTVYGGDGERRIYVAGEGYAAGWAGYRTVNETDERVETLVTNHVRP